MLGDEQGQAILEYVLSIVLAIAVVGILAGAFRASVVKLWVMMSREISAACPGCPADPTVR